MSTPQGPYGPQNPYGMPPQGPYAAGPNAQQPYGQPLAPQPQPQPPYGTPYAQTPYPQQQPYGWGVPPMSPPPAKRRIGLVFGIVGGVVAVIAVVLFAGSKMANSGFPEAEYELSLPKTLENGRYRLTKDLSDSEGRKLRDQAAGAWDGKLDGVVVGHYGLGGDQAKGTLAVTGMYGRFKYPDSIRDEMMKGGGDAEGAKVAVGPRDFHPDGSDGLTITCEVSTQTELGTEVTVTLCGWADDNTSGSMAEATAATRTQNPADVDLNKAAVATLQVRSEMRKAIE